MDITPLPGDLFISSNVPNLIALLDNLPYHLAGNKDPAYKKLPPLNNAGKKISLPAGEYSLTIKEDMPWWKRFSLFPPKRLPVRTETQKITIRQGEILTAVADTNIADGTLKLEIQ